MTGVSCEQRSVDSGERHHNPPDHVLPATIGERRAEEAPMYGTAFAVRHLPVADCNLRSAWVMPLC